MEFSIIRVQILDVIAPNNVIAPIFSDFSGAITFHLVYTIQFVWLGYTV